MRIPRVSLPAFQRRGAWYEPPDHDWRQMTRRTGAAVAGMALTALIAYGATNWIIGLNSGSSGEAQSGAVSNLTVAAVSTPPPNEQMYPGGSSDVMVLVTNPNAFPVTITGFNLPANTSYAGGFSNIGLTTPQSGCTTSTSYVYWSFATGSSGSSHTLTTPVVVGANATLTMELDGDATMTTSSPAACENTYFQMPSLTGVAASAGGGTATTSPVLDGWTS